MGSRIIEWVELFPFKLFVVIYGPILLIMHIRCIVGKRLVKMYRMCFRGDYYVISKSYTHYLTSQIIA